MDLGDTRRLGAGPRAWLFLAKSFVGHDSVVAKRPKSSHAYFLPSLDPCAELTIPVCHPWECPGFVLGPFVLEADSYRHVVAQDHQSRWQLVA